jgi:hypothetical protein
METQRDAARSLDDGTIGRRNERLVVPMRTDSFLEDCERIGVPHEEEKVGTTLRVGSINSCAVFKPSRETPIPQWKKTQR